MPYAKNRNRICKECSAEFEVRTNGAQHLFCSVICREKHHKKKSRDTFKKRSYYKEYCRRYYFKNAYNISYEDKLKLLEEQNYKCPVCTGTPDNTKNWHLDHCHTTGRIRGALCSTCNQALGMFKDSVKTLERAIKYLNES